MRTLKEILEDAGCDTRSYSGRGMCGEKCLAVDTNNAYDFFAKILTAVRPDEVKMVAAAFRGARDDSMGRGIVVYFPMVRYEEAESDADITAEHVPPSCR